MVNRERFILFIFLCAGGVNGETKYAATGKNYTLKPSVTGTIGTILWKFHKDKLVEYEGGPLDWYLFKGRGDLDIKTGDLTLKELKKEDSGSYQSEILVDGLKYSNHDLRVIDPVPVPDVTCSVDTEGKRKLTCSVPKTVHANFKWNGPKDSKQTGETINVPNEEENKTVYFCIAANEVNENSKQFTLQECYTESESVPVAVIVSIVVAIVILVILMVAGFKFRDKIRKYLPVANK